MFNAKYNEIDIQGDKISYATSQSTLPLWEAEINQPGTFTLLLYSFLLVENLQKRESRAILINPSKDQHAHFGEFTIDLSLVGKETQGRNFRAYAGKDELNRNILLLFTRHKKEGQLLQAQDFGHPPASLAPLLIVPKYPVYEATKNARKEKGRLFEPVQAKSAIILTKSIYVLWQDAAGRNRCWTAIDTLAKLPKVIYVACDESRDLLKPNHVDDADFGAIRKVGEMVAQFLMEDTSVGFDNFESAV